MATRCGPVVQKENEAEVEWKLTYTGVRRLSFPRGPWPLALDGCSGSMLVYPVDDTKIY
jgi:hypothetical protein